MESAINVTVTATPQYLWDAVNVTVTAIPAGFAFSAIIVLLGGFLVYAMDWMF